jgi:hypothetical protein
MFRHLLNVFRRSEWVEGSEPLIIEDGFGASWEKCLRSDCSLEVVRPGKAQCEGNLDAIGCPKFVQDLIDGLIADNARLKKLLDSTTVENADKDQSFN